MRRTLFLICLLGCSAPEPGPAPHPLLGEPSLRRAGVTLDLPEERLRRGDAIEQRWRVPERPAGGGPLVVEVPFEGAREIQSSPTGLSVRTDTSAFHYGHGTWIDARGRRHHLPVKPGPGGARILVPEALLEATDYPALLDPVVSPVHQLAVPPAMVPNRSQPMGLGWDPASRRWLLLQAVEESAHRLRELGPRGHPVAETDTWLGASTPGSVARVELAAREGEVLIVRELDGLMTRRWREGAFVSEPRHLDPVGGFGLGRGLTATAEGYLLPIESRRGAEVLGLDPEGNIVSRRRFGEGRPGLACGAGACLVAFRDASGLHAQRIDARGAPLEPAPRLLAAFTGSDDGAVAVAADGDVFLVLTETREGSRAALLAPDGSVTSVDAGPGATDVVGGRGVFLTLGERLTWISRSGAPLASVIPDGYRSPRRHAVGAFDGTRWIVLGSEPVVGFVFDAPGSLEAVVPLGEMTAVPWRPRVTCGPDACLAVWYERSYDRDESVVRASWLDPDGRPEAPFELPAPSRALVVVSGTDSHAVVGWAGPPARLQTWDRGTRARRDVSVPPGVIGAPHCGPDTCLVRGPTVGAFFDPAAETWSDLDTDLPADPTVIAGGPRGFLEVSSAGVTLLSPSERRGISGLPFTPRAVAGTADGWLTCAGTSVVAVDADGAPGRAHALPSGCLSIHCGDSHCWVRVAGALTSALVLTDLRGEVLAGPSTIPRGEIEDIAYRGQERAAVLHLVDGPGNGDHRLLSARLEVGADDGASCVVDAECGSGHCVEGVCCESACLGGCEACSVALGGSEDGRCTAVSAGWVCRESGGACDPEEICDGVGVDCPADARLEPGAICRPAEGPCDVEDRCDPSGHCRYAFDETAAVCRPAAGACDAPEVCDGLMAECPAEWAAAEGTECRPSTGPCDVSDTCDGVHLHCGFDQRAADGMSCDDGDVCDGAETCAAGECAEGRPLRCDDGDRCTADACDAIAGCTHVEVAGCCRSHADCEDGDVCTRDRCLEGGCQRLPIAGCCHEDAECGAGESCLDHRCAPHADGGLPTPSVPATGCGCGVVGRRPPAWLLLLVLGWLAGRRRRGRRACVSLPG